MAYDGRPPAPPTAPASLARDRAQPLSEPCAIRSTRYVPDAPSLASPYRLARRLVQVAVPGLFLSLAACGGNMEEPKIRLNSSPKEAYELRVQIADAPGDFDWVRATADYGVTNPNCGYIQPISGALIEPRKRVIAPLRRNRDGTFSATFFIDQVLDDDYFGKGICHWQFIAISVSAAHSGDMIQASIDQNELDSNTQSITYFSRRVFRKPISFGIDLGTQNREKMPNPEDSFSIRMNTAKVVNK